MNTLFDKRVVSFFYRFRTSFLISLSIFGPATITAMADNDAAGVATYSLVGAKFGYSILFVLLIITFLLAITQEMGVRIAIVTGKGLGDIIRERFGVKMAVLVFTSLFIANTGTLIANFAAIKITGSLFNLPALVLILLIIIASFLFVVKGNYRTNQNIFLISALFYICYIVSAFKAKPDWGLALTSVVIPRNLTFSRDFVFASIAVLGTTITPWGQFFVQSYVLDKKLTIKNLRFSQVETYFGAFITNFFSFFMIVATAATLFAYKIPLVSGEQAALAIKPFAGELASTLFGFGIFNAGFMGIVVISLTTAYAFSEFFGFEGSLDAPFTKGGLFYGIFLFQLIIPALIVMSPSISLFTIVFFTQSLNGILLPVMFFFLLQTSNNKEIMGKYINKRWYNYFAVIASAVIVVAVIFTIVANLFF
ncbi:MAG: divalent metal cation transporter [Patescibacteria group bacterium]